MLENLINELITLAETNEAMYVAEEQAYQLAKINYQGVACFEVDYSDRNPDNSKEVVVSATNVAKQWRNSTVSNNTTDNTNTITNTLTPIKEAKGFTVFRGYEHPKRVLNFTPREAKYPWDEMEIGDAIFVPAQWNAERGAYTSVVSAVSLQNSKQAKGAQAKRFTSRKGEDASGQKGEWIACEAYKAPRKRTKKTEA